MKKCFLILSLILGGTLQCQVIKLHSISTQRQTKGDVGYTLDGPLMINSSRLKLVEPGYFDYPSGIYSKWIEITDEFETSNSLTVVTQFNPHDLFFFGGFNELDPSTNQFTDDEIDSLYLWSLRGGKMIITSGQYYSNYYTTSMLDGYWNYGWTLSVPSNIGGTPEGQKTDIFNGPFGSFSILQQGGAAQGYFSELPPDAKILGNDQLGRPTLFLDCKTLDLVVADVDAFTELGGISIGGKINNDQDRFWANTIVFMDRMQQPPVLNKNGNALSLNDNYVHYNWYHNGQLIPTSGSVFTPTLSGIYYSEVTLNGGCVLRSNEITVKLPAPPPPVKPDTLYYALPPPPPIPTECNVFVPQGFSPDLNGINEMACVYSSCIEKMEFRIYDRWGEMVFASNDKQQCWDGTFKGRLLENGVFAWTLTATLTDGIKVNQKGNISLVR